MLTSGIIAFLFHVAVKVESLSPGVFQWLYTCTLTLVVVTCQYIPFFISDRSLRDRAVTTMFTLYLPLPSLLNLQMTCCYAFSAFIFLHQCLAAFLHIHVHNDNIAVRFFVNLAVIHIFWHRIAQRHHIIMREMFDTQRQLQVEKEASLLTLEKLQTEKEASDTLLEQLELEKSSMEALLTMVCDASIWLSTDGNSIVRSDKHFDAMLGSAMLNESFIDCLPDLERGRVTKALQPESVASYLPVRLLQTSIMRHSGAPLEVDLFIVNRQHPQSVCDLGYLVGVRCHNTESIASSAAEHESIDNNVRDWWSHAPSGIKSRSSQRNGSDAHLARRNGASHRSNLFRDGPKPVSVTSKSRKENPSAVQLETVQPMQDTGVRLQSSEGLENYLPVPGLCPDSTNDCAEINHPREKAIQWFLALLAFVYISLDAYLHIPTQNAPA